MTAKIPVPVRICAALLAVCLVLPGLAVYGAEPQSIPEYNAAVREKAVSLEEKYGIEIRYPVGSDTRRSGIGTGTLATLDTCLGYVTPTAVKQLSGWYRSKTGSTLTFSFTNTFQTGRGVTAAPVAGFTYLEALIEIYVPSSTDRRRTGAGPTAIIHELGHAFFECFKARHGAKALSAQWQKLNGGAAYGVQDQWDRTVFTSRYAATGYEEDFADAFAYSFVCNRAGFSIAKYLKTPAGAYTPLGGKIACLQNLMATYFPKAETALDNMKKCWTTPSTFRYENLSLSGSSLEYMGYNAPVNTLNTVLGQLSLEAASSAWIKAAGGWEVETTSGGRYLVFPSGTKAKLK